MKLKKTFIALLIFVLSINLYAQNLKPYILSTTIDGTVADVTQTVKGNLTTAGFDVIGEYSPANDPDRNVIVISADELLDAVKSNGGLTGFASALRVGITNEDGTINISYTNPIYMGNAYFRNDFESVKSNYKSVAAKLIAAFSNIGETKNVPFGSEKGISEKSLKKYRYMIGMQKFDNVAVLNEFDSFETAVNTIDANLASTNNLVYSIDLPDQKLKLYGIAVGGEKGEERFLPIIDINSPKHTAFLPYELLVMDKKAVILHGRYRIALSFPDLTMMTFSKIMSTPGDIKNALKSFTE